MPNASERKRPMRREERVSRTYRLPLSKLKAAQRALGAATATEAIERALDLAVFQRELVDGTRAMLGVDITSPAIEPRLERRGSMRSTHSSSSMRSASRPPTRLSNDSIKRSRRSSISASSWLRSCARV